MASKKKDFGKCLFKPLRANQKACSLDATTEWGFCSKHVRTVQAKAAKDHYTEEQNKKFEEDMKAFDEEIDKINLSESEDSGDEQNTRVIIKTNKWGKFEDEDTGIVFNPDTKAAYGVQAENGEVYELDEEAIQTCIENGWAYIESSNKIKAKRPVKPEEEEDDEPEEEEIEEIEEEDNDDEEEEEEEEVEEEEVEDSEGEKEKEDEEDVAEEETEEEEDE